MRKFLFALSLVGFFQFAEAQQIVPAPSPLARNMQMVGLTEMEIEYSSPALKGRRLFSSELVPQGELWRTGANAATKITFSDQVQIGDNEIPAGTYAIFSIPGEREVKFMFNSNPNQSGTSNYDKSLDVATVETRLEKTQSSQERMRFTFENTTSESTDLVWEWGPYKARIAIETNSQEKALENIKSKLEEIDRLYSFYNQAATYYLDNDIDAAIALEYATKSVEGREAFWNVYTLARAYHANGQKKEAKKYAQASMKMAKEANYPSYVTMGETLLREIDN